jgi:hypothetical protein
MAAEAPSSARFRLSETVAASEGRPLILSG